MKLKSIFAVAVVAVGAFAAAAQAAPTWTVTTQGTISSGFDTSGVFGSVGQNLAGLSYTQTVNASVDPSQYTSYFSGTGFAQMLGSNAPGFTDTVTVNGRTVSFSITQSSYAEQFIADGAWTNQPPGFDEIYTFQSGYDSALNLITAYNYAYTNLPASAFVPTLDFGQTIVASAGFGLVLDSTFSIEGTNLAYFRGAPNSIIVNGNTAPADVPEPASIALLGLGCVGMGLLRRRKAS